MRVYIAEQLQLYQLLFPALFERYDFYIQLGYTLHDLSFQTSFKAGQFKLKLELAGVDDCIYLSQFISGVVIHEVREYSKQLEKPE